MIGITIFALVALISGSAIWSEYRKNQWLQDMKRPLNIEVVCDHWHDVQCDVQCQYHWLARLQYAVNITLTPLAFETCLVKAPDMVDILITNDPLREWIYAARIPNIIPIMSRCPRWLTHERQPALQLAEQLLPEDVWARNLVQDWRPFMANNIQVTRTLLQKLNETVCPPNKHADIGSERAEYIRTRRGPLGPVKRFVFLLRQVIELDLGSIVTQWTDDHLHVLGLTCVTQDDVRDLFHIRCLDMLERLQPNDPLGPWLRSRATFKDEMAAPAVPVPVPAAPAPAVPTAPSVSNIFHVT